MNGFRRLKKTLDHPKSGLVAVALLSMVYSPVGQGNVIGTSFQNFNPTTGSHDYVTVHSSRTIGAGRFSLGLFLNQAYNTLPYSEEEQESVKQDRGNLNDSVLGADVAIGMGLLPRWDIGIVLPQVLNQTVDSDEEHGQFAENGITEYRLMTKVRLIDAGLSGMAVVASSNINQVNNNPYAGDSGGPAYNLELVGDLDFGRASIAGNLGYRWANSGEGADFVPIQPSGDHMIMSAALGVKITHKWQAILEMFGASEAKKDFDFSDRNGASAETLAGLKYFKTPALAFNFGGGTEMIHGTATPDWRIYAGVNWNAPYKKKPGVRRIAKKSQPKPAASGMPERVVLISDVMFNFNSARLVKKGSLKNIDSLANSLRKPPELDRVIIEGHTCSVGEANYNRDLSKKRAETIKQLLVQRYKIPASKIFTVGFGEDRPLATNKTSAGRKQNRRVEFKIYRKNGKKAVPAQVAKK